jgi:glycosyltransferase involved in cell wall biosynthesis
MDNTVNQISPMISVVMSVYNSEMFLREAIDSVLEQTFKDFEFIIINDGSIDCSLEIIKSYNDKRIVLIENEGNKGLIHSLNKGLEIAKGQYVARMDADDICLPERFRKQVEFLELNPNVGVLGCDYISINEKRERNILAIDSCPKIKTFLLFTATMCHPTLMLRKQVLIDNKLSYSEAAKHVEDYDLWCRLALSTDFFNLNEILFKYRDHANQVSHQNRALQIQNSNVIQENYLKNLGFLYSGSDLKTHFLISSNVRIRNRQSLREIEKWLLNLIEQNANKIIISRKEFNIAISKMWLDCCGNTNLGLWSYVYFQKSNLKYTTKYYSGFNLKLFVKCIIRWIK